MSRPTGFGAGKYWRRFTWLQRTTQTESTYGQREELFDDNGSLWGFIQNLSAMDRIAYGARYDQIDCLIRIRQKPAISARDRLVLESTGETYELHGPMEGPDINDNELILPATRLKLP